MFHVKKLKTYRVLQMDSSLDDHFETTLLSYSIHEIELTYLSQFVGPVIFPDLNKSTATYTDDKGLTWVQMKNNPDRSFVEIVDR